MQASPSIVPSPGARLAVSSEWALALLAPLLLALLTWWLPNPLAEQGVAVYPSLSMSQPGVLLYVHFGTALTILLMSVVLWTWLKEWLFLHFAVMVAVGWLYTALRYGIEGPLPDGAPTAQVLSVVYCVHCIVATTFFSLLFEFRRNWVWAARIFKAVAWFNVAALVVALAGGFATVSRAVVFVALLSTSFGALFVLYVLAVRRRWQYLPGALSFAVPACVGIVTLLDSQGFLPGYLRLDTPALWFAGRLTGIFLLAVAVANRARAAERTLRVERAQALERALGAERELEQKVSERTQELLCAKDALRASLHSERETRLEQRLFFNMINHEFRTPLAVVDSAATELQVFPTADVETQRDKANQIRRACRRLTDLMESCLVNDRLDANSFRLQLDWVALRPLVEEATELVRWSQRHRLRLDLQQAPPDWDCDPGLVRIALSNLVGNAIKYAKAGDITVTVCADAAGMLHLSVSDEGPGLSADAVQRIFERYERGRETAQTSGHGLGLWITKRIALLHGGDVTVAPLPQGGSCFTLSLSSPGEDGAYGTGAALIRGG